MNHSQNYDFFYDLAVFKYYFKLFNWSQKDLILFVLAVVQGLFKSVKYLKDIMLIEFF